MTLTPPTWIATSTRSSPTPSGLDKSYKNVNIRFMAKVNISSLERELGHRVTFDGKEVEVPFALVTSGVIGLTNVLDALSSLDIKVNVRVEGNTTYINGDELMGARLISILDFVE